MTKIYLLFLFPLFLACNQPNPESVNTGPKFAISPHVFSSTLGDPNNWCSAKKGEVAVINADPQNYNRRYFALGNTPCRIIVEKGQMTAAFMLHKTGRDIHIYTGEHLPRCLCQKDNIQVSSDGLTIRYDNHRSIQFEVNFQELPGGTQIALNLPENSGYGMTVIRCDDCN